MVSSEEVNFIRRADKTSGWMWALYLSLALIIIGIIFYQFFFVFEKEQKIKYAFTQYYRSLKCSSLCPVEIVMSEDQKRIRLFDASCQRICERTYIDLLSERERALLSFENSEGNPAYLRFINYSQEYATCYHEMNIRESFDQSFCFQGLFWNISKEFDLSEVKIPSYTSHAFEISDLSCGSSPSVKITHTLGRSGTLSLVFLLEDTQGQGSSITSSSVPFVGESQIYPLSRKGLGTLSKIEVFARDVLDNRSVTNLIWKKCPPLS